MSRHRLPSPYRYLLVGLWLAPALLLLIGIFLGRGMSLAFFDPRLLLPVALMALPALYIWQEGVDVLPHGIRRRVHLPRTYTYDELSRWYLGEEVLPRMTARVLIIWDQDEARVISTHAAHLTNLPVLVAALSTHLRRDAVDERTQAAHRPGPTQYGRSANAHSPSSTESDTIQS
ncbi:MAG: hypothetical protein OHK0046_11350 [Anaerolineae bacterium]